MLIVYSEAKPGSGAYLRLGLKTEQVYARKPAKDRPPSLTADEVDQVSRIETTLRQLTHREFGLLFGDGQEVADSTLFIHCDEALPRVPRNHVMFRAA